MIKIVKKRIYTTQEKLMVRVYHGKHKLKTTPVCRFLNHVHEKPQEPTGKPLAAPDVSREDKCKIKTKPITCISNNQLENIKYK